MDTVMLCVILAVACLSLLCAVISLVVSLRKGNKDGGDLEKEVISIKAELKSNIDSLEKTIPLSISASLKDSANLQAEAFNKAAREQSEADMARLNNFQTSINQRLDEGIKALNQKVDANLEAINKKVDASLSEGFKTTSESMASLQKELGILQAAQEHLGSLQNEISSLTGILSNNQQRGRYGEWQLELLLQAMFGESKGVLYDLQYTLVKGRGDEPSLKPDAVIFLDGEKRQRIVPIDSKFSLVGYEQLFEKGATLSEEEERNCKSTFRQAFRKRVDETSKYIVAGKTVNTAIMFVPSDGIFAYIQTEFPELVESARQKNVVMASPTILQPLLYSFRLMQIDSAKSENLQKIDAAITSLSADFDRFKPRWEKLQKDINSLTSSTEQFDKTVTKLGNKFAKIKKSDVAVIDSEEEPLPVEFSGE